MARLKYTKDEIDERLALIGKFSNPNLLDNWYFANPVNQRGQTEYTTAGYTVDRWKIAAAAKVDVASDGVVLTNTGTNVSFQQIIGNAMPYVGKTVTFSVMCDATNTNSLYAAISFIGDKSTTIASVSQVSNGMFTVTGVVPSGATASTNLRVYFNVTGSMEVKCAKLEFGDHQTLAHQENGIWVLNEIPNYGEELLKCQRYCYVLPNFYNYTVPIAFGSVTGASTIRFCLTTPVDLRATPTLQNDMTLKMHYNGVSYTPESVSVVAARGNQVHLTVPNSDSLAIQSPIVLVGYGQSGSVNEQKLILSADL